MQVERQHSSSNTVGGEWRTGEEYIGICLVVGDNVGKLTLIPHAPFGGKPGTFGPGAIG